MATPKNVTQLRVSRVLGAGGTTPSKPSPTRKLMILLTDACGHKMADVFVDIDGHRHYSSDDGTILLDLPSGESKKTSVKVTSEQFEVDQPEIALTDAPAQAVVLQLSKRGFGELFVQVTDDAGDPHVNTPVLFQPLAGGQPFSARSNSKGLIRHVVPKGDYLMSTLGSSDNQVVVVAG